MGTQLPKEEEQMTRLLSEINRFFVYGIEQKAPERGSYLIWLVMVSIFNGATCGQAMIQSLTSFLIQLSCYTLFSFHLSQ